MKRAWITGLVALALALPALGQVHGVPASVTSYGAGRGATPGPPASVTSLGPRGYAGSPPANFTVPCSTPGLLIPSALGCTPAQFTPGNSLIGIRNGERVNRHPGTHRGFRPVFVPYAYPVVVGAEPEPQPAEIEEPDPPAPTVFEHRATTMRPARAPLPPAEAVAPASEEQPTVAAPIEPSPAEAREQIPIVLVYRDGHQQEVKNYAIVGSTLYDLGAFVAHKIPLAELNLKATVKANDDRGVEFALPAGLKLD